MIYTTRHADLKALNNRDTLAYVRGVPNVFDKEIPRLVRLIVGNKKGWKV